MVCELVGLRADERGGACVPTAGWSPMQPLSEPLLPGQAGALPHVPRGRRRQGPGRRRRRRRREGRRRGRGGAGGVAAQAGLPRRRLTRPPPQTAPPPSPPATVRIRTLEVVQVLAACLYHKQKLILESPTLFLKKKYQTAVSSFGNSSAVSVTRSG